MNYVIGGDLGTSAIKLILVDQNGKTIKSVEESYPLSFPEPGFKRKLIPAVRYAQCRRLP